jgi:hypothetical protein
MTPLHSFSKKVPAPAELDQWQPATTVTETPVEGLELIVDPAHGNDDTHHATTAASTRTRAASVVGSFKTIAAAVAAARDARTSASQPVHIVLKGGTHFVGETIQIAAEDS